MESDGWDFNLGGTNAMMSSVDSIDNIEGGASVECGINGELTPSSPMPALASTTQACRPASSQGGTQNCDVQRSFTQGQLHGVPSMHFSSNNLLVAAKWFHQKKLQRVMASAHPNSLPVTHLHTSDPVWSTSQGAQEAAKVSLRRLLEGAAGANQTLSVGSNGSETSSPQPISCDSRTSPLVTSMVGPPYLKEAVCFASGKEQIEHPSVFLQARPDFHENLLGSFHSSPLHLNQFQDAMWHSHPQVTHGVLTPFPSHISLNQPQDACCEGVVGKPKPRVRARRGQATDPHSIAERLRRERIADRIKSLQELLPHTNKTDRALMLDEVIDYVKFLLVQVKVLSMSRLGGAGGLVVPLVTSLSEVKSVQMPAMTEVVQDEGGGISQESLPAMEEHVARLITNNAGAALQFLQRKGLCLMPISLAESSATADASLSQGNQACALNQLGTAVTTLAKQCPMQT